MPTLERHDAVFVLDLGDSENRFHPDWLTEVNALLDEVEKGDDPRALVTAATGKFWSNGLDLEWLFAHSEQFDDYTIRAHALLARFLSLPLVTVAALQGHSSGPRSRWTCGSSAPATPTIASPSTTSGSGRRATAGSPTRQW